MRKAEIEKMLPEELQTQEAQEMQLNKVKAEIDKKVREQNVRGVAVNQITLLLIELEFNRRQTQETKNRISASEKRASEMEVRGIILDFQRRMDAHNIEKP
ncbi:MAG: hypothetical protein QF442_01310 [Candidatus Peribacteraceae bacterium]|nr:hypothetical protein [Candidatus Peribacteraceae bacterium]